MKKSWKIAIAGSATVVVAAGAAAAALAATDGIGSKHKSYRTFSGDIHRVVVDGNAGDIRVTASGDSDVEVSRSTSWLFSKPTVREYVRDGVLHLESHGHLLSMSDFHVRVPAGVAVEVSEGAADVDVLGAPGSVNVDTTAGDIHVDVTRAPHRITVETDAGDVHVGVPAGEYAVSVHAGAGDEDVHGIVRNDRAEKSIHVRTDAGDIEVERR